MFLPVDMHTNMSICVEEKILNLYLFELPLELASATST